MFRRQPPTPTPAPRRGTPAAQPPPSRMVPIILQPGQAPIAWAYDEATATEIASHLAGVGGTFISMIMEQLAEARRAYPHPRASVHEGWAYAAEEYHELTLEIFKRPTALTYAQILHESAQLSAMLIRLVEETGLLDYAHLPPK